MLCFAALFILGSEIVEAWLPHQTQGVFSATLILSRESLLLAVVTGATLCLGALEKRGLGDYGLPPRGVLRGLGWGTALAFCSLSLLVVLLSGAGVLRLGGTSLSPAQVVANGGAWAATFLVVALFEELLLRGYAQATLARSLGFWPAALVLSLLFAAMHARNGGETRLGLLAVACFGLFFCWTLWRTGSLWFAVGFHACWDWAESFFYGVPDSGALMDGHFLSASFSGPAWLSGGTAGPEGSVLVLAVLAAAALTLRRPVAGELPGRQAA